jgi:hypothetical protein
LDRRDQLGIKSEFVDECVRRSSNRKRYSRTLRKRFHEGLRSPTRAVTESTRSTGIRSANPASKRKRLRCAPTKGLPTGFERAFYARPNFVRLQEVSPPFRSGLRAPRGARNGRLNTGFEILKPFARTRKTRSRELVLRTCSAFLNKVSERKRRRRYSNGGAGKCRWSWEDETSDPRDARASARSAEFRRSLEPSRRVGLRHAWREAETPG